MKKLLILSTAIFISFSSPAFAAQTVHVGVNGLVCDFCARALEKVFGKEESVKAIDVNLDTKLITIDFKDGQSLDNDTIKELITDSGYNVENIHRMEEGDSHE